MSIRSSFERPIDGSFFPHFALIDAPLLLQEAKKETECQGAGNAIHTRLSHIKSWPTQRLQSKSFENTPTMMTRYEPRKLPDISSRSFWVFFRALSRAG